MGTNQVGDRVVDRRSDEDDVFLEQAGVEVKGPLASVGLFDHGWHQVVVHLHRREAAHVGGDRGRVDGLVSFRHPVHSSSCPSGNELSVSPTFSASAGMAD